MYSFQCCLTDVIIFNAVRYIDAKSDCDKAIGLDPTYVKAYFRRGTIFLRFGRPLKAEEDFRKVMSLDPGNVDAQKELDILTTRKVTCLIYGFSGLQNNRKFWQITQGNLKMFLGFIRGTLYYMDYFVLLLA